MSRPNAHVTLVMNDCDTGEACLACGVTLVLPGVLLVGLVLTVAFLVTVVLALVSGMTMVTLVRCGAAFATFLVKVVTMVPFADSWW